VIVRSESWHDAVNNWNIDKFTRFRRTPLRELIEFMPELALVVFDNSINDTLDSVDDDGTEHHTVTYDYTFLDDVEWANLTLSHPGQLTDRRCCHCIPYCWWSAIWHRLCGCCKSSLLDVQSGKKLGAGGLNSYEQFQGDAIALY
jgi:hypothetical protein